MLLWNLTKELREIINTDNFYTMKKENISYHFYCVFYCVNYYNKKLILMKI